MARQTRDELREAIQVRQERLKPRLDAMSPEDRARVEAAIAGTKAPEKRAEYARVRERYKDKPSLNELIRRGEVDPERILTQGGSLALHDALGQAKKAREATGLTLTEVAQRSGLTLPAVSRLEAGKNPGFTFETLCRYAAAIGLDVEIALRPQHGPPPAGATPADVAERARLVDLARGKLAEAMGILGEASGSAGVSAGMPK